MRLSEIAVAVFLGSLAATVCSAQQPEPTKPEVYRLTANRWLLAVAEPEGKAPPPPAWIEWKDSHWAWASDDFPEDWSDVLDQLNGDGRGVTFGVPDAGVVLRVQGEIARLTFVESVSPIAFEFVLDHGTWRKKTVKEDIRLESLLHLPANAYNSPQLQGLFQGVTLSGSKWGAFWNDWIASLYKMKDERLTFYIDRDGHLRHLLLQSVTEEDWKRRSRGSVSALLGMVQNSPAPRVAPPGIPPRLHRDTRSDPGPQQGASKQPALVLGTIILTSLILLVVLSWPFRNRLSRLFRKEILRLACRMAPPPEGIPSLVEAIESAHQEILADLHRLPLTDPNRAINIMMLNFSLERYKIAAAGIPLYVVPPNLLAPSPSSGATDPPEPRRGKKAEHNLEVADFGEFALERLRRRRHFRSAEEARGLLVGELKRLDDFAAQSEVEREHAEKLNDKIRNLQDDRNKIAERERLLKTEQENAKSNLEAQLRQQQKNRETEQKAWNDERAHLVQQNLQLETEKKKLKEQRDKSHEDLMTAEGKSKAAVAAKEQEFAIVRQALQEDKRKAVSNAQRLSDQLTDIEQQKKAIEARAESLHLTLQQERKRHEAQDADGQVLEGKLSRIAQAGKFLSQAQIAYWDRCQHPASTGAHLYSSYLGLYQSLAGALQKDALVESAGWTNIWNLLHRFAQVPGLDRWQREFVQRIYPEIESMQLQDRQIVDRNQPDKERFVQSMVLQGLLSGEVQIDGDSRSPFKLDQLRGWPLYFRIDQDRVWSAS